jgi:phospholipase/carboxylesterase
MLTTDFIPAQNADSRRLMVVLHGLGDSMEGFRWMPAALNLPQLNYLLVNAPDEYYGGYSWYDIYTNPDPGVERSRKALFDLLDAQREAGFPSEQTTVFGFSQGCLMTLEIACRYPHRLAGLVGVSGYAHHPETLVQELDPTATSQRVLMTHGTSDTVIPIDKTRQHVALLKSADLQIDYREFAKDHTIAGEEELSVIREFVSS